MMEGVEEQAAHSPPPSLVPRIHVILLNKLKHINPLIPQNLTFDSPGDLLYLLNKLYVFVISKSREVVAEYFVSELRYPE